MNEPLSVLADTSACWSLQMAITIPLIAGIILFLIPDKLQTIKGILALAVSLAAAYFSVRLFSSSSPVNQAGQVIPQGCITFFNPDPLKNGGEVLAFTIDGLSRMIILFISIMTVLILLYTLVYNRFAKVRG